MRLVLPMGVVALLATVGTAWATPSARLVYARSPDAASCPDEASLHKAVGARFGYDPFFAWAKKTVVVQIWRDHLRYAARVQLVDDQGVLNGARELRSDEKTCADLFSAVALAISIALDASINVAPAPNVTAPAPADAPAPPPEPPGPAVPAPTAPAPPPPPPAPPPEGRTSVHPAPPPPSREPWLFGVEALGVEGVTIAPAPGLAVFAARRLGALSLGVELQAAASFPSNVQLSPSPQLPMGAGPAGSIESALLIAAFAPCYYFGPVFACVLGEIGWQHAWSSGFSETQSAGTPFAAVGGRLGAGVRVSSRYFLRAHIDSLLDLNPVTFQISGQPVGSANPAAFVVGVGAGAFFL